MSQEEDNQRRLEAERESSQEKKETPPEEEKKQTKKGEGKPKASIKKLSKNIASAASLIGFIETRDIFFITAITMALLKDIFDLGIIGTILTPLTFILTVAAMLVCGESHYFGKKKATTLLLGNLIEFLPGLNFLPMETLSTVLIYVFLLQERKDASAEKKSTQAEKDEEISNYNA
ncbi:MAG: hypothetical protein WC848_01890 [Parcubacteria group bacterium]|jgi:hypothetical protein